MGFKVSRLWDPPYLQVAFDMPNLDFVLKSIEQLPKNDHLIIEAGTPLIKRYGIDVISQIRKVKPDAFIVADLKTLDTGNLEARMVADAAGDAIVISALAPLTTIIKAIEEAHNTGIYSIIDTLNLQDPIPLIMELSKKNINPDIIEIHRAIDSENINTKWDIIIKIKNILPKVLIAVAGGIRIDTIKDALEAKADILVVGRAITGSKNIRSVTEQIIAKIGNLEIDQFRIMTDF